jgi:pyrroline-5-carboxylate reductase
MPPCRALEIKMEKIVVIGVGFIGQYMGKGIRKILGIDDLHGRVFGIKGSPSGVRGRSAALGYEVSVADSGRVLQRERPSIILLSPPPARAEGILKNDILPYCDICRKEGLSLPDIYSYIPSPSPLVMRNVLGEDVNVVKILPNMLDNVRGYDLSPYGINYLTFPENTDWPKERKELLYRCMDCYGHTAAISDTDSLVLLAGKITSHVCYEASYALEDRLKKAGHTIPLNHIGMAMREAQYELFPDADRIGKSGPVRLPAADTFIREFMRGWFTGLNRFSHENVRQLDILEADRIDMCSFLLNVFPIAHSPREVLEQDTRNAATKGGILERGIEVFNQSVETSLRDCLEAYLNGGACDICKKAEAWAYLISSEAYKRSLHLA